MHLLERYSLSCGVKIDKPFILGKFFPLAIDNFITLHPYSKGSKSYDLWQDVVNILHPVLKEQNIHILQMGVKNDRPLQGCYHTMGQTNLGQAAYILSHSMLHLGADSFATHIASGLGKKIVALYSNNYVNVVKPVWGNPEDHILFEPNRETLKPSFSAEEHPKTINTIKPEDIAAAVLRLLKIHTEIPFRTEFVGSHYTNRLFETVPNQVVDISTFGLDAIIVRMDFLHDENCLVEQLKRSPCCIVTNKPISANILKTFRQHVKEVVYDIQKDNSPNFVRILQENALVHFLSSDLEGADLDAIKLDYLDFPIINNKIKPAPEVIKGLRDLNRKLMYTSAKITLSNGKMYPSKAAWLADKPINGLNENLSEVIDNNEFWKESESFRIVSTTK